MQIIDNKALLLKVRDPLRITNVIPKSHMVDDHQVLVRWGLDEVQVLKNLGIKNLPSPINKNYDWPGLYKPFHHQRITAEFLTLHRRAFCFNEQGCVDADTEYLSPLGWRRIADYTGGEVAQWEDGAITFVNPLEYVKLPCQQMIKIKTKYGLDQMLSPEHRVLLEDGKQATTKREVISAAELLRRHDAYHNGTRAKVGGTKSGTNTIAFTAATIPTTFLGGSKGLSWDDATLRVMVAVIADGYFGSNTNHCVVRLKKERKKLRLRQLLTDAGIPYKERAVKPTGFSKFVFAAPRRVKEFDAPFWEASSAQLAIIAEECLLWDGCTTRGARFSTTSKLSADFIQYAFSATKRTARVITQNRNDGRKTEYTVQIRDNTRLFIRSSRCTVTTTPSTDGYKYCFMVPSTFLVFRRNGCVFVSGNTGKTASVIWAADYLMKMGYIRRVLVLCPLSIMGSAWQQDLFRFAMHRSVTIAHHRSSRKRKELIKQDTEFVVMNYDGVEIVKDEILADGRFDLIVVDEANAYKTASTNRWKTFNKLVKPDTWLWMLTGTPASQSPEDAYGLAKLVNPSGVPKFYGAFRDMVMNKITQFKWAPKPNAVETVHKVLQPAIRFTKEQCLDLPEMTYTFRETPLSKQQQKYYDIMRTQMLVEAAGEEISAINAAAKLTKLLQISAGAAYADNKEIVDFDCKDRMKVLKEVIDEASHKVLVFAPFRHSIYAIAQELKKSGYTLDVIDGSVSPGKRTEIFSKFQTEKDPRILVIQPQAASHGVTLHAADTVVWWSPVTSVETYLQANARVHRAGQKNKVTIVHLQGSPVERRMYKMLSGKVDVHEKLVDLYKEEMKDDDRTES